MWFFKKKDSSAAKPRSFVSVRMEAIGGQGANTAGKILAEAAVLGRGYTGNHFSSFGSEKRGAPVRSFVRFSPDHQPVRTASYIKNPDILVIFHDSLIETHPEVLDGADERTALILNTSKKANELTFPTHLKLGAIRLIDALDISIKQNCGINAVLLGALLEFCPEVDPLNLEQTLSRYFDQKIPGAGKRNVAGFKEGIKDPQTVRTHSLTFATNPQAAPLPEMGWENAPIGGAIVNPGNSVLKDHSASRKGVAPFLQKEICFNCGFCDMVCPDFCFVWKKDAAGKPDLQGIDYQYCKGCQKCISVCPVEALVARPEKEIDGASKIIKQFPDVKESIAVQLTTHPSSILFEEKRSQEKKDQT